MAKEYVIAIDLHGTLLNMRWKIAPEQREPLLAILEQVASIADIYICSGNDFDFIRQYVEPEVLAYMAGCVLETGCVLHDFTTQTYLIDEGTRLKVKELEKGLMAKKYPFVKYFGKREATISLFTRNEFGGEPPQRFFDMVQHDIDRHKYADLFYLTFSNVALDIIPIGYTKWGTIDQIAEGRPVVSFIDSYNDREIALYSHMTFMPKNSANVLREYLIQHQRSVLPIEAFTFQEGTACLCSKKYTEGVIEGLELFYNYVGQRG